MTVTQIVLAEIKHRMTSFLLGAFAVAIVASSVVCGLGLLRVHDAQTESQIAELEASTEAEMKALEDSIRKSMKGLGFNIYIFPEGQDMSEVYAQGYASKTMPESYVSTLANSKIVTVNHLLPQLTQKLTWPEQKRTVLLIGVRGEVPLMHSDPKKPLIHPVDKGKIVLGYELHQALGLKKGDTTTLMGKTLEVSQTHAERGSVDDITIWMNLEEVQELLNKPKLINSILALECNCATVDRLGEVRKEILAILPGTQIIEKGSQALARAEARVKAGKTAKAQMDAINEQRATQRRQRQSLAAAASTGLAVLCLAVIGILAMLNVRDRLREIGILRAIGVGSTTILASFLMRAALIGVVGAVAGIAIGAAILATVYNTPLSSLLRGSELIALAAGLPLLACAAAWLPALYAANQQPAKVLRND